MRKQNRNNRICTNEESGKTDFIIDPLLPIGKENAITTQELMDLTVNKWHLLTLCGLTGTKQKNRRNMKSYRLICNK